MSHRRGRIANLIKANLHIVEGKVWMPYLNDGDGDLVVRLLEVIPIRRVYYDGGKWVSREMDDSEPVSDSAQFVGYAGKNQDEEASWLVTEEQAEVGRQMVCIKNEHEGWGQWSIDPKLESDESVINHVAILSDIESEDANRILDEIQFLGLE